MVELLGVQADGHLLNHNLRLVYFMCESSSLVDA